MNAASIAPMLLGAALVAIGVLVAALADRIRGNRAAGRELVNRRTRATVPRPPSVSSAGDAPSAGTGAEAATERMARDVTAALVTAGYDKASSTIAVQACAGSERATLETWTRAALRRCMSSAASGVVGTEKKGNRP